MSLRTFENMACVMYSSHIYFLDVLIGFEIFPLSKAALVKYPMHSVNKKWVILLVGFGLWQDIRYLTSPNICSVPCPIELPT